MPTGAKQLHLCLYLDNLLEVEKMSSMFDQLCEAQIRMTKDFKFNHLLYSQ